MKIAAGSLCALLLAARYLREHGVAPADFQTHGFRRGNHEMAMRGTFASGRLKNGMAPGVEGGYTRLQPDGTVVPIFDAAGTYRSRGVPLIIIAGVLLLAKLTDLQNHR